MLALTLIVEEENHKFDIQVDEKQRILDTLAILEESGKIGVQMEDVKVYSERNQEYRSPLLSYEQAQLYNGDTLHIR